MGCAHKGREPGDEAKPAPSAVKYIPSLEELVVKTCDLCTTCDSPLLKTTETRAGNALINCMPHPSHMVGIGRMKGKQCWC